MLVDAVSKVAPVVHNFDRIAPHPEALSLFFAITTLLILPKALFFFIWLNSSRLGMYRHFIVSPLTATSPRNLREFVTEPLHDEEKRDENPRSLFSRIFWSLLIIVIGCLLGFVVLQFGWDIGKPVVGADLEKMKRIAGGGLALWFAWSLKWTTFEGLLFAVVICIVRDYLVFLKRLIFVRRKAHE